MEEFNSEPRFENLIRILDEYRIKAEETYKGKLDSQNKNASHNLYDSISTEIIQGDEHFDVVMNLADYWIYVENGRGAGKMPPVDKILEWIRVKPVLPQPSPSGKLPTEEQLAFLIARSIGENGIQAGNQLYETVEEVNTVYLPLLQDALANDFALYSAEIETFVGSFRV